MIKLKSDKGRYRFCFFCVRKGQTDFFPQRNQFLDDEYTDMLTFFPEIITSLYKVVVIRLQKISFYLRSSNSNYDSLNL